MPHTFKKEEKLCSLKAIGTLLQEGKRLYTDIFRVIYTQTELDVNRLVISVPKKLFKRAVDRNLIKRRIREAYRNNKELLKSQGSVDFMIIYNIKEIEEYATIERSLIKVLEKMTKNGRGKQ